MHVRIYRAIQTEYHTNAYKNCQRIILEKESKKAGTRSS